MISQPGSASPAAPYRGRAARAASRAPPCSSSAPPKRRSRPRPAGPRAEESAFTQLARLAIPSGLGEQAPLIAEGIDAVAISSAGERPLAAADDQLDDLGPESIDAFGRAIQSAIGAVDVAVAEPSTGPSAHIEVGRNLVPGWALAALALRAAPARGRGRRRRLRAGDARAARDRRGAGLGGGPLPAVRRRARRLLRPGRGRARARPRLPLRPRPLRDRGSGRGRPRRSSCSPPAATVAALRFGRNDRRRAGSGGRRPGHRRRGVRRLRSCSGSRTRTWRCCACGLRTSGCSPSGAPGGLRRALGTLACVAACVPALAALARGRGGARPRRRRPVDARADGRRRPDRARRHAAALFRRRGARGGRGPARAQATRSRARIRGSPPNGPGGRRLQPRTSVEAGASIRAQEADLSV